MVKATIKKDGISFGVFGYKRGDKEVKSSDKPKDLYLLLEVSSPDSIPFPITPQFPVVVKIQQPEEEKVVDESYPEYTPLEERKVLSDDDRAARQEHLNDQYMKIQAVMKLYNLKQITKEEMETQSNAIIHNMMESMEGGF